MYQSASSVQLKKQQIGIAIGNGMLGTHLGIAYVGENDAQQILHLAFHQRLRIDPLLDDATWAIHIVEMDEDLAGVAIGLIDTIAKKYLFQNNGGIAYGINLFEAVKAFKDNNDYLLGPNADGLTCASFVAAIFEGAYLPIVDVSTWQPHSKNIVWGKAIVCMLNCANAPAEHISAVESNISGLRLRPEEVAAGAEIFDPNRPASQKQTQKRALGVVDEMRAICGPQEKVTDACYCVCVRDYDAGMNSWLRWMPAWLLGSINWVMYKWGSSTP